MTNTPRLQAYADNDGTPPSSPPPCPDWCVVRHGGTGPDHFHKSVQGGVESFGQHIRANLFQHVGEDCEPGIVVAGIGMTIGQATAFADVLRHVRRHRARPLRCRTFLTHPFARFCNANSWCVR